jgi:hypothetical protein
MSRTPLYTALALTAALASAVPAAATPRAVRPPAVAPAVPGLAHQALAWLAALWGGGPQRAAIAREVSSAGVDPNSQTSAYVQVRPIHFPSGGGIDPNG